MKKILFILSLVLLISCGKEIQENQSKNEQSQTTVIKSDNIQYDIKIKVVVFQRIIGLDVNV